MMNAEKKLPGLTRFSLSRQLVVTDADDDWPAVVEQIAQLQALLDDISAEADAFSLDAAEQLRDMLEHTRARLRDLCRA